VRLPEYPQEKRKRKDSLVKREAFQNSIDKIAARRPEAKQAKPGQFYNNGPVQELDKEGFFG
jgi:hypothetical protein